ncbi:hypothetical protein IMZ48_33370 [Candidatus Bathyarchaeota archaeon]|nr:hypothetical protein [Candidatus Bathyarchaeota archaeon]
MDGDDHVDDDEDNLELLDGIYRHLKVEDAKFLEAIPDEDLCEDEQLYLVDGEGKKTEFAQDTLAAIDNETPSAASIAESPEVSRCDTSAYLPPKHGLQWRRPASLARLNGSCHPES